jgi:glucose/arabinose dehydrogenase
MGTIGSGTGRSRLITGAVVFGLFGALLASCTNASIKVSYSKTPARDTTTVTVTVIGHTVTQTTVRVDAADATPAATSTAASFSFDLDTTALSEGAHRLFVTSATTSGTLSGQYPFTVDNSPPLLPSGFQQSTVFGGLTQPVAVRFAADGRVFVAEKSGLILVFAGITASTPTVFADLRPQVYNAGGHGLLGMALDPAFPTNPYIYVLYTLDAPIGATPPVWHDTCPTPPGIEINGCVVSARLSRLQAAGNVMTGPERVLINDWCQQYSTHSIGTVLFGTDGALYASAGDGATYTSVDYGQLGVPTNPCGDPPVPAGGAQTPPNAEGGALRSQALLRPSAETVTLDGSIIRVDPATGAALPDNPNAASSNPNARRIVAYGLRNPFRMTTRPGTNELWIGDVGWNAAEEIDRVVDPAASPVENFGWPCYEGNAKQPGYDALNLNICNKLSASHAAIAPYFEYQHDASVVTGDGCRTEPTSITGTAFYPATGGNYPSKYNGALFFSDYSRGCIWVMLAGSNGLPDPTKIEDFVTGTTGVSPVDLEIGPGGDLFYADIGGGTIRRIRYNPDSQVPVAVLDASPSNGLLPLTVKFDARRSTDPDGDPLTYSWDLNGDGVFGDATSPNPSYTFTTAGARTVSVRVSDPLNDQDVATVTIDAGNTPPVPTISTPSPQLTWRVGDTISFSGSASDAQDGALPPSALSWRYDTMLCPTPGTCSIDPGLTFDGVTSGSFAAQPQEYPSHLRLSLTATDSGGLSQTTFVDLYPRTSTLTLASDPAGATLTLGSTTGVAPFNTTVITGGLQSISAPDQTIGGQADVFAGWSDGGASSHDITVSGATTLTATFAPAPP